MDPDRHREARRIFVAARRMRSAERASFIAEESGGDDGLRAEVESLLAYDDPEPVEDRATDDLRESDVRQVGPYRIVSVLGEGGFGVVYLAEREEPMVQRVALKLIKPGMDSDEVIARFEQERSALAVMDHPNVARVYDAGTTPDGRPYFVMEYVPGVPITEYCNRHGLSIRRRLELFVSVCEAVQHAHMKGIVHRDIKPSNVLVVSPDESGSQAALPKIIDFGVAKAIEHTLTGHTVFTRQGQLIGTPVYMSPEQAEMSEVDIDTRSDIYALGVLLYEMLTGTTPFDSEDLLGKGLAEMMRVIREDEPPRPSTRLSSLGATPVQTEQRQSDPRKLSLLLRGDLDWVVMKCLEKDRTRRYEAASELARDLVRHLQNEPVMARPPSRSYKMRKFVRRHRVPVGAGVAIVALLLVGVVALSLMYRWARQEESESARRAALLERVTEFQSEQLATVDLERMGDRLQSALLDAAPEDGRVELGEAFNQINFTSVARQSINDNILQVSLEAIDARFTDEPILQAQFLQIHASTLSRLGLIDEAEASQERALALRRAALGDDDPQTLESVRAMGRLLMTMERPDAAEAYLEEALDGRRRVLGARHVDTIESINDMAELHLSRQAFAEAERWLTEALEAAEGNEDANSERLKTLNTMGMLHAMQGDFEQAVVSYKQAEEGTRLAFGPNDRRTLISVNNVAAMYFRLGDLREAETYFREILRIRRQTQGDRHMDTLVSMNNLGVILERLGDSEGAAALHREALEGRLAELGPDHPHTLSSMNNLGTVLGRQGELEEAEGHLRLAVAGLTVAEGRGASHPETLMATANLGDVLNQLDRHAEALEVLVPGEAAARQVWTGPRESQIALLLVHLGTAKGGVGDFEEGEAILMEAHGLLANGSPGDRERCVRELVALHERWHESAPDAGHDVVAETWRARLAGEGQ